MSIDTFADVMKAMPPAVRELPATMGDLYDYVQLLLTSVTELKAELRALREKTEGPLRR